MWPSPSGTYCWSAVGSVFAKRKNSFHRLTERAPWRSGSGGGLAIKRSRIRLSPNALLSAARNMSLTLYTLPLSPSSSLSLGFGQGRWYSAVAKAWRESCASRHSGSAIIRMYETAFYTLKKPFLMYSVAVSDTKIIIQTISREPLFCNTT